MIIFKNHCLPYLSIINLIKVMEVKMTNIFYTGINMIISMIRTSYRLKTVNSRGRRCVVGKGLEIINGQFMSFGSNIHISNYSRIETIYMRDDKYNSPNLIIGDNVTMEWFTHIACASQLK